jgi:hypothetical protein
MSLLLGARAESAVLYQGATLVGCGKTRPWVGPGFSPDINRVNFDGLQALGERISDFLEALGMYEEKAYLRA